MVFGHRTGKRSVRRRAPAEGLDDLDAVDILDERGVHGLLACDVARHLLFVSTHHAQVEQDAEWDGGDTRQPMRQSIANTIAIASTGANTLLGSSGMKCAIASSS